MTAYKFLRHGAIGRFSGYSWPLPATHRRGDWVTVAGPLELCVNGIHACTALDLPYWLDEELWVVELDGERLEAESAIVARRGRLVDRVEAWPDAAAELARACAARVGELASRSSGDARLAEYAQDAAEAARHGSAGVALAFYAAASAAQLLEPDGFVVERRRQGAQLAARLAQGQPPPRDHVR